MQFDVVDWGLIEYQQALDAQKELLLKRIDDQIPDTLIFCQHPSVITLGRASQRDQEKLGPVPYPTLFVERGGHATYHGPGQIVIYPIVKLGPAKNSQFPKGLKSFVVWLEEITIECLKNYKIVAQRVEGKTGVWVRQGERKIASIGVAVKHWCTYHGLALNYATGLEPWRHINPCGFSSEIMTDIYRESENILSYEDLKKSMVKSVSFLNIQRCSQKTIFNKSSISIENL